MTPETTRIAVDDRVLIIAFERFEPTMTGSGFELVRARLPFVDRLRRDIEAYRRLPATDEERAVARLPVRFDLDEPDADQDAGNGSSA
jgi:hypothetical protein